MFSNLRKVKVLLDALEKAQKNVSYYALDLMYDELARTLALVPHGGYEYVRCAGLWGTYDDGLAWLKEPKNASRPKAILSMGSSIGNFTPEEAVDFLAQFAAEIRGDDMMLIALDGCQDADRVYHAYNDRGDVTHSFTSNGLRHANRILGYDAFRTEDWEATGEFDKQGSRHRAFVVPKKEVTVEGVRIRKGEKVRIEESYKWPKHEADALWRAVSAKSGSRIVEGAFYANEKGQDGEDGSYCKAYYPCFGDLITTLLESFKRHAHWNLSSLHRVYFRTNTLLTNLQFYTCCSIRK